MPFSEEVVEAIKVLNASGDDTPTERLQKHLALMVAMQRRDTPSEWAYNSVEDLVLKAGKVYQPQVLPMGNVLGEPKHCFHNSFHATAMSINLTYVEGYAMTMYTGLPVHHAWCVDGRGRVIDLTWPWQDDDPEKAFWAEGGTMIGVEIPSKLVGRVWTRRNHAGVLSDYEHNFPALHAPWEPQGERLIALYNALPIRGMAARAPRTRKPKTERASTRAAR